MKLCAIISLKVILIVNVCGLSLRKLPSDLGLMEGHSNIIPSYKTPNNGNKLEKQGGFYDPFNMIDTEEVNKILEAILRQQGGKCCANYLSNLERGKVNKKRSFRNIPFGWLRWNRAYRGSKRSEDLKTKRHYPDTDEVKSLEHIVDNDEGRSFLGGILHLLNLKKLPDFPKGETKNGFYDKLKKSVERYIKEDKRSLDSLRIPLNRPGRK